MAKDPYSALVGPELSFAGIDQGIDFTGAGPVYALGDGIVTRLQRSGSGWPGEGALLTYRITDGAEKNHYVYVAEDFNARDGLKVGSKIKSGQELGRATGSGKAPGIEVGYATATGRPLAPRPAPRPADQFTAIGKSFDDAVRSLAGAVTEGDPHTADGFYPRGKDGQPVDPSPTGTGQVTEPAKHAAKKAKEAATGWVADLTGWLEDRGKLVLAYLLLIGVAAGLFLTGLKGIGAPMPKLPRQLPVPE